MSAALSVTVPALALLAFLAVVGVAIRLLLARWVVLPRGLGVTLGLGIAVGVVVVTACYRLVGAAEGAVLPLGAVALAVVVVSAWRASRGPRRDWGAGWVSAAPTRWDAVAAGVALVVLAPLLRLGLTYWTSFINDFPNYAASAQVWLSAAGGGPSFADVHQDPFGTWQVHRADTEKPMVTALLVILSRVTGVQPYAALGPVVTVSLVVTVGSLVALATACRVPGRLAVPAIVIPTVSIAPMSRLFDAQIGQVVAVALAAVALAVVASPRREDVRGARWVHAGVAGVVVAACVGANPTLVLGVAPTLVALTVWLARWRGLPLPALAAHGGRTAAVALLLSAPMLGWYAVSIARQTDGSAGVAVPLVGPASMLGLQAGLDRGPGTVAALVQWAVVLVLGLAAYAAVRRTSSLPAPLTGALVGVTVANGAAVAALTGVTNYATHKWTAVVVALVVPLLVARLVAATAVRAPRWTQGAVLGLAATAVVVCWSAAGSVVVRAGEGLLALADDPRLARLGVVNVALGDVYENSIGPLVVPTPRVVVLAPTYAEAAPPDGDWVLVRRTDASTFTHDAVVELDDTYALIRLDLVRGEGVMAVGPQLAQSRTVLFGSGRLSADGAAWITGASSWVVLDVDTRLRGRDLTVSLVGSRPLEDALVGVTVSVDGGSADARWSDDGAGGTSLIVPVTARATTVDGGRVAIHLTRSDPAARAGIGELDPRPLGLWITAVEIAAASR